MMATPRLEVSPTRRSALLALGLALAGSAGAQGGPLTLPEALARAEQGPAVQRALRQVRRAEADLALAQAQARVQLTAAGQGGVQWEAGTPGAQALAELGLSLPLGGDHPLRQAASAALLNLRSAQSQWRTARAAQREQVARAFGQLAQAEGQRRQDALRLDLARLQARALEERQRMGAATSLEVLNAGLAVTTAAQTLTQDEYALSDARLALARLIGLEGVPAGIAPPPEPPALPDPAQTLALVEQSPAVELARFQLDLARLAAREAELGRWPDLTLGVGYQTDRLTAGVNLTYPRGALGGNLAYQAAGTALNKDVTAPTLNLFLRASVPLTDGGAGAENVRRAAGAVADAEAELDLARRETRDQLAGALGTAQVDRQGVGAQGAALEAARRGLEEAEGRLAAGSVTALEVLAARVQLAAAEGALIAAQLRVYEDLYRIYAVLGLGGDP